MLSKKIVSQKHIFHTVFIFIILSWNISFSYSQNNDTIPRYEFPEERISKDDFYQRIETLAEEAGEEIDYSELIEELRYYARHPLNLNFAREEDLGIFFF